VSQAHPIHAAVIKTDRVRLSRHLRYVVRAVLRALHDSRRRAAQTALSDYRHLLQK
jgi:hypothetical protein